MSNLSQFQPLRRPRPKRRLSLLPPTAPSCPRRLRLRPRLSLRLEPKLRNQRRTLRSISARPTRRRKLGNAPNAPSASVLSTTPMTRRPGGRPSEPSALASMRATWPTASTRRYRSASRSEGASARANRTPQGMPSDATTAGETAGEVGVSEAAATARTAGPIPVEMDPGSRVVVESPLILSRKPRWRPARNVSLLLPRSPSGGRVVTPRFTLFLAARKVVTKWETWVTDCRWHGQEKG